MAHMTRARSSRRLWGMLVPYLLGLVALVTIPAIATVVLSGFDYDLVRPPRFLGLGNFRELLDDEVFRIALRNSLVFAAVAVPLRVLGALGAALLLAAPGRGIALSRTGVIVPAILPDVAVALAWLWILNPLYGPLNLTLQAVGAPTPGWLSEPAAAQAAVVLISLFQLGEGFVLALAARLQVPTELYEAAAVEGLGALRTFARVTLPLMLPALALLLFRDTAYSLQVSFGPALLVTEGGPPPYATTYLPLFVYRNAFEYLRYGYASSAAVVMVALTAAIVWLQYRIVRRWRATLLPES
jgi:multiple sugar transport system permease protein